MRIATFILGLILSGLMTLQSCVIYVGGGVVDALSDDATGRSLATSGVMGLFVTFLAIIGMAFTLGLPIVAAVFYILAALFAFSIAPDYPDMQIHGIALIILAVMAVVSRRRKPKDPERERALHTA